MISNSSVLIPSQGIGHHRVSLLLILKSTGRTASNSWAKPTDTTVRSALRIVCVILWACNFTGAKSLLEFAFQCTLQEIKKCIHSIYCAFTRPNNLLKFSSCKTNLQSELHVPIVVGVLHLPVRRKLISIFVTLCTLYRKLFYEVAVF
jgi:hypothetical protein